MDDCYWIYEYLSWIIEPLFGIIYGPFLMSKLRNCSILSEYWKISHGIWNLHMKYFCEMDSIGTCLVIVIIIIYFCFSSFHLWEESMGITNSKWNSNNQCKLDDTMAIKRNNLLSLRGWQSGEIPQRWWVLMIDDEYGDSFREHLFTTWKAWRDQKATHLLHCNSVDTYI